MKKTIFIILLLIYLIPSALAAEFSLSDIYSSPADFDNALRFGGLEEKMARYQGQLSDPAALKKAAELFETYNAELEKLFAYAYLSHAADTRDGAASERLAAVRAAAERLDRAVAPIKAELAELKGVKLPDDGTLRELAESLRFPQELASIVLNADFNAPVIVRPDGTQASADYSELIRALSGTDREYRKTVYDAYYSALKSHRNTLAAAMDAHIDGRQRQARLRDPGSTHEYQVFFERYQLPPHSGDILLRTVYNTLGIYRRGGVLQAARLGVEEYSPYDAEPVPGTEEGRYTYDEAVKLILNALAPLGSEYLTIAERILNSNHINIYPANGKMSGAFCMSAGSGIDPFIHLNFDGSLNSVGTLAHELGHAVHFVFSKEETPALTVTETAAITNEILLAKYLLREAADFMELNCAASAYADLISSTLYNQTRLFAFERAAYNHILNGGTLTADKADELWQAISEPFRSGKLIIPDNAMGAWSAVPHLYRDFYVANYAFSVAAAETFTRLLLENGAENYIAFLSAGGSQPAYDLFLDMGVDFLRKEAYNDVVSQFDDLHDIIERLISIVTTDGHVRPNEENVNAA